MRAQPMMELMGSFIAWVLSSVASGAFMLGAVLALGWLLSLYYRHL